MRDDRTILIARQDKQHAGRKLELSTQ